MPASYTIGPPPSLASYTLPSYKGPDWAVPNLGDSSAYGSRPSAPPIISTGPQATAGAISAGNTAFNQLPGYQQSLANVGANIQAETAGQLPQDVVDFISQQAAERGVATGSPGSPNSTASLLDALGLQSLNLTQLGQQALNTQTAALPGAAISQNPNFYVSPQQQYEADLQRSIFSAAPDPAAAARAAMGASAAGLSAGMGAASPMFAPTVPTITPANTAPSGPLMATGTDVNTGWNPALNTEAMTQQQVDEILQQYAPTATGAGSNTTTGSVDQSAGDLYSEFGESYGQDYYPTDTGE